MTELQQSPPYAAYISSLGWKVTTINNVQIFHRHIVFLGGIAKMQRPDKLPEVHSLVKFLHEQHISKIAIEPSPCISQVKLDAYGAALKKSGIHIITTPFIPTKTIIVDLAKSEDEIFGSFSEAKRRAVRKAKKNGIFIAESSNIASLKSVKDESAGLFGFITTSGTKQLWNTFFPHHATTLLAYEEGKQNRIIGGVLLVFWNSVGYYWIAGATSHAKKLFVPTALAWESMRTAKRNGCTSFDFVGVWDERMPDENRSWLGFTKFKEGFGGTYLYYPFLQ